MQRRRAADRGRHLAGHRPRAGADGRRSDRKHPAAGSGLGRPSDLREDKWRRCRAPNAGAAGVLAAPAAWRLRRCGAKVRSRAGHSGRAHTGAWRPFGRPGPWLRSPTRLPPAGRPRRGRPPGPSFASPPAGSLGQASACPLVSAQLAPDGSHPGDLRLQRWQGPAVRPRGGRDSACGHGIDLLPGGIRFPAARPQRRAGGGWPEAPARLGQSRLSGSRRTRVCGSAELFERRDGGWRSVATLLPPADEDGLTRFGQSVAMTSDGSLALVGGTGEPGLAGALWVYALGQGAPRLLQRLSADAPEASFANDLALSSDGAWLAVGGEQSVHHFRAGGRRLHVAQDHRPAGSRSPAISGRRWPFPGMAGTCWSARRAPIAPRAIAAAWPTCSSVIGTGSCRARSGRP